MHRAPHRPTINSIYKLKLIAVLPTDSIAINSKFSCIFFEDEDYPNRNSSPKAFHAKSLKSQLSLGLGGHSRKMFPVFLFAFILHVSAVSCVTVSVCVCFSVLHTLCHERARESPDLFMWYASVHLCIHKYATINYKWNAFCMMHDSVMHVPDRRIGVGVRHICSYAHFP